MIDIHTEQWSLYERAMKTLEKENVAPEFQKPAVHPLEVETMQTVNKAATTSTFLMPYKDGQYERIFHNSLHRRGYIVDELGETLASVEE